MRNQQESGGNRYQFRLHPAPPPSPPPLSPTSSTTTSSSSSSSSSSSMSATSSAASSPTLLSATIMTSQQQKLQKPLMTKIDEVQNITNNNNNNTSKIINNSSSNNNNNNDVNNCGSEKSKVKVVKDVAGTTATAIHMQRKQFTPTSDASNSSFSSASVAGSIQDDMSDQCSLTQAGLEEYNIRASSYYDQPALYHHQKQSSYAQSEGYHSYVSSSDSSSATPFLDRLRQESELLSRQSLNWSQNDLSSVSCNSVAPSPTPLLLNTNTMDQRQELLLQQQSPSQKNHNSSESTSSTETLKWLGSMSDVSEASHATGYSTISESVSTSQLIVHSSRVLTPKRHHSESVLYLNDNNSNNELLQQQHPQQQQHSPTTQENGKNLNSLPQMSTASSENGIVDSSNDLDRSPTLRFTPNHRHSPSYPPIHTTPQQTIYSYQQKPLLTAMSARFLRRDSNDCLNKSPCEGTKNSIHASAATPCKPSTDKTNNMPPSPPLKRNTENTSPASSPGSGSDTNCYRSNHRLFPVSTYTEPVHSNTSHYVLHPKPQYSAGLKKNLLKGQQQTSDKKTLPMKSLSPPNNAANTNKNSTNSTLSPPYPSWQSVAALINDFERSKNSQEQPQQQQQQQQKQTIIQGQSQKYTYMDPSKTHRVSNPALKAFQKNAVQSYFERQQQQQQKHSKDPQQQHKIYNQLQQEQRPHSYQAAASPKEVNSEQLLRNSLPNTTTMPAVNRRNSPPEIEFTLNKKSPSPTPPPPPPRSRSLMPNLLRRSSSASDYAEFKEQYTAQNNADSPLATVRTVSSAEKISFNDCGMPPPPPPPRGRPSFTTTRRTSSASEYAAMRDKALLQQAAAAFAQAKQHAQQAPHAYYAPPAVQANGKEGWVPERPPKNPNLRIPSPDLPPPPANTDVEVTGVSDEPLPPPPPEVYNRTVANNASPTQSSNYTKLSQSSEVLSKPPQANRRNSFAGSSERKVKSENANAQQPPLIPKKPQNIQLAAQVTARPNSSLGQQQQQQQQQPTKTHKVVLNGLKTPTNVLSPSAVGQNRKRLHNNATFISVQPIMEHSHVSTKSSPPPPLMPRVPVTSQAVILPGPAIAVNTKLRSNSKASYLPRQSLEKLNNLDPDHGSYKLTLNSNEDLVVSHHTKSSYDIFAQHHNHIHAQLNHHLHNHNGLPQSVLNGKLPPNNLPDVLPLGVKLHTQQAQPASPTSATPTLRYGSNNNLSNNSTSSTANSSPTASTTIYPPMYPPPPTHHRYSSPSMTAYNNNNNNTVTTQSYSRSQSFDATQPQSALKYMSQSTIDLKKPTSLETTLEETATTEHLLSPAQSESNLSSPVKIKSPDPAQNNFKPLSPCSARREFHRSVDGGSNNEARIFRAELVNATLMNTHSQSAHKLVARKESLRENIEKITQLQSKLMGAHISGSFDGGSMSSFGNNYHNGNKSISPSMKSSPSLEQIADNKFVDSNTQTEQRSTEKVANMSECGSPKSTEYVGMVVPPMSAMNQSTDGLKLMQRSEIILRVNPIMTEAACQTDDLADGDMGRLTEHHGKDDPQMSRTTLQPRIRHPIEIDCDNISQELANLLSAQDKLVHILRPHTPKSPSDYVTNLYNPDVPSQPSRRDVGTSTLMRMKTKEKEPKDQDKDVDELMANNMDIKFKPNEVSLQINGHEESDEEDGCNQIKKKVEELIKQITRKVVILNIEQNCINEETALNDELGSNLTNKLSQKVRPLEANKFRTYIDDVGDITSLLLSLAERLARTENTLSNMEEGSEKSLEQKRDRLFEQLDEAKRLKADIEKRGDLMANMLERYFGARENADFDYFINMKAKLITDARDIAEKIKFSEEQLNALNETLIQSDC